MANQRPVQTYYSTDRRRAHEKRYDRRGHSCNPNNAKLAAVAKLQAPESPYVRADVYIGWNGRHAHTVIRRPNGDITVTRGTP